MQSKIMNQFHLLLHCMHTRDNKGHIVVSSFCASISGCHQNLFLHSNLKIVTLDIYSCKTIYYHQRSVFPPTVSRAHDDHVSIFTYLESLVKNDNVIILGDFSFPDIDRTALTSDSIFPTIHCDLVFHYNLVQKCVCSCSHQWQILDLVMSNFSDLVVDLSVTTSTKH